MIARPCGRLPLCDDRRGVALIEFALVLPVLILLFVGGYQLSDAVFASRKVTRTARTVSDLASQYTQVTDSDLDTILAASQQVMSPYPIAATKIRVSQVVIDRNGTATIDWSRGRNIAPYAKGQTFTMPASFRQTSTTIIVADVSYDYTPGFATKLIGPITLRDQMTMFPRNSATVAKK